MQHPRQMIGAERSAAASRDLQRTPVRESCYLMVEMPAITPTAF